MSPRYDYVGPIGDARSKLVELARDLVAADTRLSLFEIPWSGPTDPNALTIAVNEAEDAENAFVDHLRELLAHRPVTE